MISDLRSTISGDEAKQIMVSPFSGKLFTEKLISQNIREPPFITDVVLKNTLPSSLYSKNRLTGSVLERFR